MTDQDLVLAKQAGDYVTKVYTPPVRSKTPGKIWEAGHVGWYTQFTAKFAALIRADAMEAATRAANESWTLLAKALVLAEREACAKVCEKQEDYGPLCDTPEDCAEAIRARGNT